MKKVSWLWYGIYGLLGIAAACYASEDSMRMAAPDVAAEQSVPQTATQSISERPFVVSVEDTGAPESETTERIEEKRRAVIALVERGLKGFKERSFDAMLHAINHTNEFKHGELYLYLFDENAILMAHGEDPRQTWKNYYDVKDEFGNYAMRGIVSTALQGGGWYVYRWRNTTKVAYVQMVEKNGKKYALGCGYYPLAKQEFAFGLVRGAVSAFKRLRAKGYDKEIIFGSFSYPYGTFIHGDLHLYVLTEKGITLVYGDQFGLIGESLWDYKDENGKYSYREIIQTLKNKAPGEGVWREYMQKGALKRAYAERVIDTDGKSYIILSGYYPKADRSQAISLVKKGTAYLEAHGPQEASQKFTRPPLKAFEIQNPFRLGDLYLQAYDFDGVCIAHGNNREYVGRNLSDELKDADGNFIVKDLIAKAREKRQGWLDFRIKNAFWSIYFERVDVAGKQYIVCCGMYPTTKKEMMMLMVRTAHEFFMSQPNHPAFTMFSNAKGSFTRGDLEIFILDTTGLCYVWGLDYVRIWKNCLTWTDENGKPYVKMLINGTQQGAITLTAQEQGAQKIYYATQVSKAGKTYIIGSGFYL